LPVTTSLKALVYLAHQRWAIEQQYQELKHELGLDHFEGRSLPGWQRHVVLTALAYAWLPAERRRRGARLPTLPIARAIITEILTAHLLVLHPHYLDTMLKLREISLRISQRSTNEALPQTVEHVVLCSEELGRSEAGPR
jgi:hypothetical protein